MVEFFVFPLLWTDMFLVQFHTVLTIKQTRLHMTFPTHVSRNDVTNWKHKNNHQRIFLETVAF